MANNTTNYNLVKPLVGEYYDVDVPNGNMDIIDSTMKSISNTANGKQNALVERTFNIAVSAWTGTTAPFTATVTVSGITTSSKGSIGPNLIGASKATRDAIRNAQISVTTVATNSVTFTADGEKPTVVIPCVAMIG